MKKALVFTLAAIVLLAVVPAASEAHWHHWHRYQYSYPYPVYPYGPQVVYPPPVVVYPAPPVSYARPQVVIQLAPPPAPVAPPVMVRVLPPPAVQPQEPPAPAETKVESKVNVEGAAGAVNVEAKVDCTECTVNVQQHVTMRGAATSKQAVAKPAAVKAEKLKEYLAEVQKIREKIREEHFDKKPAASATRKVWPMVVGITAGILLFLAAVLMTVRGTRRRHRRSDPEPPAPEPRPAEVPPAPAEPAAPAAPAEPAPASPAARAPRPRTRTPSAQ